MLKNVTIAARCQQTDALFEMRGEMRAPNIWAINGACAVREAGEFCDGAEPAAIHGTFPLDPAYPGCPHCRNRSFYRCGCGKVVCWDGTTMRNTCPWCRNTASIGKEPLTSLEAIGNEDGNRNYEPGREYRRRENPRRVMQ